PFWKKKRTDACVPVARQTDALCDRSHDIDASSSEMGLRCDATMTPGCAALSKQHAITDPQRDGSVPSKPDAASEDGPPFFSLDAEDIGSPVHRVVALTLRIARAMGMSEEELMYIRAGAFLHDIGMVGVPDEILFKSDQLTDQEWKIVRRHPIYA